jgi:lipoprotein-anchoring transpeptidase ErfK/SrfK
MSAENTEVLMHRRRRSSRYLSIILVCAAVAGAAVTLYRLRGSDYAPTQLAAVDRPGSPVTPPAPDPARRPLYDGATLTRTQTPNPPPKSTPAAAPAVTPAASPAPKATTPAPQAPAPMTVAKAVDPPAPAVLPMPTPAPKTAAPAPASSGGIIGDAKALADAGQPVKARSLLNESLISGKLPEGDLADARRMLGSLNQEIIFSKKIFADDPNQLAYTVQSGEVLSKLAQGRNVTWELLCRINGIADPAKLRAGQTVKMLKGPFHAVVHKSQFRLEIYLGTPDESGATFIRSFPVGLGKDDSTPAGKWLVQSQRKLKNPTYYSPRGEGIIAADDPRNPLGKFWIGLTGTSGDAVGRLSYGIHGTIDPNSIGKMESLGCIRMLNEDVALVFDLLVEGKSSVVVRD